MPRPGRKTLQQMSQQQPVPPSAGKSQPELTPEQKKEVSRKRQLVKKQFYPFLEESTKSIEEAMNLCQILTITIQQAWQQKQNKSTLKSLKLTSQLNKDADDYRKYKWALDLFEEETVSTALDLINGMNSAIGAFVKKKNMKTPLKELSEEVDLLD